MHADDLFEFYSDVLSEEPWDIVGDPRLVGIDFISFTDEDNAAFRGELRINQEGDIAVLVLVATELLSSVDAGGT